MSREMHGMTDTPEYRIWSDMKTRCYNAKSVGFPLYGGRGIHVCGAWLHSFSTFLRDMGQRPSPSHSIDRKDPNGHYAPDNCRWATPHQQANNKRSTVRVVGVPVAEMARSTGIKRGTLYRRVTQGRRPHPPLGPQVMTLDHNGVLDTVAGWSKRTGIKSSTITMRITHYGWTVAKALSIGATQCV